MIATSGRIVRSSSSSRSILPSPSPDGANLIAPDIWCFATYASSSPLAVAMTVAPAISAERLRHLDFQNDDRS